MKAYELVIRKDDWLRPINRQGNKWKTKVNWMLAEQYFKVQDGEHMRALLDFIEPGVVQR